MAAEAIESSDCGLDLILGEIGGREGWLPRGMVSTVHGGEGKGSVPDPADRTGSGEAWRMNLVIPLMGSIIKCLGLFNEHLF